MAAAAAMPKTSVQHGEHTDTIESVDLVFREQRKLSFTYGAAFFAVTLAIPALSVWVPAWYQASFWGGFTLNYFVVSLAYFLFLWTMAWTYSKQADKLDEKLMHIADEIEAKAKAESGDAS
jgi:uncharacterized membrane protein (DUF485 family)